MSSQKARKAEECSTQFLSLERQRKRKRGLHSGDERPAKKPRQSQRAAASQSTQPTRAAHLHSISIEADAKKLDQREARLCEDDWSACSSVDEESDEPEDKDDSEIPNGTLRK
jgi:hypothetical protein